MIVSSPWIAVRHSSLFYKLSTMSLPDEVYNWIKNFYDHRSHCASFGGELSDFLNIFASVIQGSAL